MNKQGVDKNVSHMMNGLREASERALKAAQWLYNDSNYSAKFRLWSGSSNHLAHHYGDYGLITHTTEVVSTVGIMGILHKLSKKEIETALIAAAFHDSGKMFDYERNEINGIVAYDSNLHKRQIHHISRSAMVWQEFLKYHTEYDDIADDVTHCILAHHLRPEWGSPIAPQTRAAWIVHCCDQMSARCYDRSKYDESDT